MQSLDTTNIYGYIYLITNICNNKQYVGQTTRSVLARWKNHCAPYNKGKMLYQSVLKYGKENFIVEILKTCYSKRSLNYNERKFIKQLSTLAPKGYNLTVGGEHYTSVNTLEQQQTLLEWAEQGKKRPSARSKDPVIKKYGHHLQNYTSHSSGSFNLKFNKKIRAIAPQWFTNSTKSKKEVLIQMAALNQKRPSSTSKDKQEWQLGNALKDYTDSKENSFDLNFTQDIKRLRPDWFENSADKNKQRIMELAKNGTCRPKQHSSNLKEHKLAQVLGRYTTPKSRNRDEEFIKALQKIRPDWFASSSKENKKILLQLAINNHKRPSQESKNLIEQRLGEALSRYTSKNHLDVKFNKQIRTIAPQWFIRSGKLKKAWSK